MTPGRSPDNDDDRGPVVWTTAWSLASAGATVTPFAAGLLARSAMRA